MSTDPDGDAELVALVEQHLGQRASVLEGFGGYGAVAPGWSITPSASAFGEPPYVTTATASTRAVRLARGTRDAADEAVFAHRNRTGRGSYQASFVLVQEGAGGSARWRRAGS
ncbi:hypothetical protein ABGB16_27785 [Micromonospora sp. B11E3]|uniref:hypothetical protein n=1 Tax=Micromonospora sp. B11E3 TaxID=3153562 RepID=UPI00325E0D59